MRHFPRVAAAAGGLFASGLLIALSAGVAHSGQNVTSYAGVDDGGHNIVVVYSETNEATSFFAYGIPLNQSACPGQSANVFLFNVPVTPQETFDSFNGVQGALGTYALNALQRPRVSGTIYVGAGTPCANNVNYTAETNVALQGDFDCDWPIFYAATVQGSGVPEPAEGQAPDFFDAITLGDMLNSLKDAAGLPTDPRPTGCPAPGTTTPSGEIVGDPDCSGETGPGDPLAVILQLSGTPSDPSGPHCVKVGRFILLDR